MTHLLALLVGCASPSADVVPLAVRAEPLASDARAAVAPLAPEATAMGAPETADLPADDGTFAVPSPALRAARASDLVVAANGAYGACTIGPDGAWSCARPVDSVFHRPTAPRATTRTVARAPAVDACSCRPARPVGPPPPEVIWDNGLSTDGRGFGTGVDAGDWRAHAVRWTAIPRATPVAHPARLGQLACAHDTVSYTATDPSMNTASGSFDRIPVTGGVVAQGRAAYTIRPDGTWVGGSGGASHGGGPAPGGGSVAASSGGLTVVRGGVVTTVAATGFTGITVTGGASAASGVALSPPVRR